MDTRELPVSRCRVTQTCEELNAIWPVDGAAGTSLALVGAMVPYVASTLPSFRRVRPY